MTGKEKPTYTNGTSSGDNPCDKIHDNTFLSSPNPEIVPHLQIGTLLELAIINNNVLVAKVKSEIAGSITSARQARIIQCINEGYDFVATVTSIDGGKCKITIKPQ